MNWLVKSLIICVLVCAAGYAIAQDPTDTRSEAKAKRQRAEKCFELKKTLEEYTELTKRALSHIPGYSVGPDGPRILARKRRQIEAFLTNFPAAISRKVNDYMDETEYCFGFNKLDSCTQSRYLREGTIRLYCDEWTNTGKNPED